MKTMAEDRGWWRPGQQVHYFAKPENKIGRNASSETADRRCRTMFWMKLLLVAGILIGAYGLPTASSQTADSVVGRPVELRDYKCKTVRKGTPVIVMSCMYTQHGCAGDCSRGTAPRDYTQCYPEKGSTCKISGYSTVTMKATEVAPCLRLTQRAIGCKCGKFVELDDDVEMTIDLVVPKCS